MRKYLQFGLEAALGDLPCPGKARGIPDDAIAWVWHCACQKPKALGYSYELWTYAILQMHLRKHCVEAGHPSLRQLSRSKQHILTQGEIRLHRLRYYVERRHASVDFISFLEKLDAEYPEQTKIRLLLDNHSAHISKQTRAYLHLHPQRFEFVFTPKHGSWLNIVETMFSKMARSMLRGIRVTSKQQLIARIHQYFEEVNADPVVFRWKYNWTRLALAS